MAALGSLKLKVEHAAVLLGDCGPEIAPPLVPKGLRDLEIRSLG